MRYVGDDGVEHTKPTVTRTEQQALIRARGLWKKAAWVEALKPAYVHKRANEALCGWLDGLTMIARCLDVLILSQHCQELVDGGPGNYAPLVKEVRRLLSLPFGGLVLAYRVGDAVMHPGSGLPMLRGVKGHGWSWDEAFEMAERALESERAKREEASP